MPFNTRCSCQSNLFAMGNNFYMSTAIKVPNSVSQLMKMRFGRSISKMYLTKNQITNAYLEDKSIRTDIQIVANTYMNISYDRLTKMLSLINAQLNKKLFRYYQKYPDKRIGFHCCHERVEDNTHSHILLRIPPEYDCKDIVIKLGRLWNQLGKRTKWYGTGFQFYKDFEVEDEKNCTRYTIKKNYHVTI